MQVEELKTEPEEECDKEGESGRSLNLICWLTFQLHARMFVIQVVNLVDGFLDTGKHMCRPAHYLFT